MIYKKENMMKYEFFRKNNNWYMLISMNNETKLFRLKNTVDTDNILNVVKVLQQDLELDDCFINVNFTNTKE